MWKLFLLVVVGCITLANAAAALAAESPAADKFIVLSRPLEEPDFGIPPILDRELIRQAFLIVARDDLGLWTRDEVLDETMPKVSGDLEQRKISLRIVSGADGKRLLVEFNGKGKFEQSILDLPFLPNKLYPTETVPDLFATTAKIEELSRTKYSDWLKSAGFGDPKAKPIAADETIPKDIEVRLEDLTIFSQYAAIRAAHQAIADNEPTRGMLEVLARGYANLGQITRFHWTGSSDVFTARSLLYAQRLVNSAPNLARTRWTRAYVLAMAGLHAAAMADLDAVKGTDDAPPWVTMIDRLCHYDTPALEDLAGTVDPQYMLLCEFMAFLTVENSNITSVIMQAGKPIVEATPNCDRVIDAMCDTAGVSYLHNLTDSRFDATVSLYRQELPRILDLPKSVSDAWQAAHANQDLMADIASVAQAFLDSSEPAEPSWSALGKMLQESNFVHVYRRAYFMVFSWDVDCADFVRQAGVLAAGHRFEPVIKSLATYNHLEPSEKARGIEPVDETFRFPYQSVWSEMDFHDDGWERVWKTQRAHVNATAWDCERNSLTNWTAAYDGDKVIEHSHWLRAISPFSPIGPAQIVKNNFVQEPNPRMPKAIDDLNAEFGQQPAFVSVVADYYLRVRQYDKAIPTLQSLIPRSQSVQDYRKLADCYFFTKDEDRWLSTLEDSLKLEDFALDHAGTQQIIANHFMANQNYQRAVGYADAAAESGAGWAMECAARCHAGLGEWDIAQQLVKDDIERYGRSPGPLYSLIKASGHGNLDSSRQALTEYLKDKPKDRYNIILAIGEDQTDKELGFLRSLVADNPKVRFDGMWLATIEEQSGDHQDAIVSMRRALSAANPDDENPLLSNYLSSIALYILRAEGAMPGPRGGPRGAPSATRPTDPLDNLLNGMATFSPADQAILQFFLGEFLIGPGNRPDKGLQCLQYSALNSGIDDSAGFMARMELLKHNIDPFHPGIPSTQPTSQPTTQPSN